MTCLIFWGKATYITNKGCQYCSCKDCTPRKVNRDYLLTQLWGPKKGVHCLTVLTILLQRGHEQVMCWCRGDVTWHWGKQMIHRIPPNSRGWRSFSNELIRDTIGKYDKIDKVLEYWSMKLTSSLNHSGETFQTACLVLWQPIGTSSQPLLFRQRPYPGYSTARTLHCTARNLRQWESRHPTFQMLAGIGFWWTNARW